MRQLEGKVAMVTGAARGIGRAISIGLAQQGANLVLADILDMKETQAAVTSHGVMAEAVLTDLIIEQQIVNLFDIAIKRFGRLDILVNNAGIFVKEPIDEMSIETWDRCIDIELRAPFICTKLAFPIMKKQGVGRIINIGSVSAQRVRPLTAPYNAAKFGLVGLTHTAALEGRSFGITCGILHPGVTGDEEKKARTGNPEPYMAWEETAATVVYMACQPPHINILEVIQLPREQPYLGRG